VVIPAFNEAEAIGKVLRKIPDWVDEVVVVDNGSTDATAMLAEAAGARVVHEPRRGYGSACLAGIDAAQGPDVLVFLDADYSDHPEEMNLVVDPIVRDEVDFVVGSRVLGNAEPGSLTPQARFGNRFACLLLRWIWGAAFTDLGPFRAIRANTLRSLHMQDRDYGWTVEMQIKAARDGVRCREVPVSYHRRIGRSKISGTAKGAVLAGSKILLTVARYGLRGSRDRGPR